MSNSNESEENECRLCGKVSNSACTYNIFGKLDDEVELVQLIRDFLPVLIYKSDPLPKTVCETCCGHLRNFNHFKKKCLIYFGSQKQKLESKSDITENEKLFLDALKKSSNNNIKNGLSDLQVADEEIDQQSESELCAELQNAIKESLTQTQLEEKRQEQAYNIRVATNLTENGFGNFVNGSIEDDSSRDSYFKQKTNVGYSESQSDMELCDSPSDVTLIVTDLATKRPLLDKEDLEPPLKRRKLIGPKSCIERLRAKYGEAALYLPVKKQEPLVYNPLSLLQCVLNFINKRNVPGYTCKNYTACSLASLEKWKIFEDFDKESKCNYCEDSFNNMKMLARHEQNHISIVIKDKVDSPNLWFPEVRDTRIRNKWVRSLLGEEETIVADREDLDVDSYEDENIRDELIRNGDIPPVENHERVVEEEVIEEDQSLLVPVEEKNSLNSTKGEVVLIDTIAMVNGKPLSEIPKDERRTLFKSVTVNGVKRKFCPLCRYTFKDNWAIESHYFSSGCHYTCRFCGLRFNKQRGEFDEHIKGHILKGDKKTDKIFASRKAHLPPKVISCNRMKVKPPYVPSKPLPRARALRVKAMLQDSEQVQIKKEPGTETPPPNFVPEINKNKNVTVNDTYKPQNQAYFCRKCYQVFFKLDEFNVHVVSCNGTGPPPIETTVGRYQRKLSPARPSHRQASMSNSEPSDNGKSDTESYSPSGRPMRHCVKEAGPYVDEDYETEVSRPRVMNSSVPTARGYECSLCSSCFPTKYSRNSHMRIHKNDYGLKRLNDQSIAIHRNRPNSIAKKAVNAVEQQGIPTYQKYIDNVRIKQEPTEPIVEIHEEEGRNLNYPTNIGSVSITPIPNANHKTNVDPDIMRLVQSNPNITIKTMSRSDMSTASEYSYNYMNNRNMNHSTPNHNRNVANNSMPMNNHLMPNTLSDNDNRFYRCSSCSKPFSNKSNLYFHKKNQCTGSKYPCPFCRKRFGTEAAYSSHIFYNHPE